MNFFLDLLKKMANLKWSMFFYLHYFLDSQFRTFINYSKTISRDNKGKTCIICGNGPSLKKVDTKLLKNNFVITVNNIYKNKSLFESLDTDCHIIIDPSFIIDQEKFKEVIKEVSSSKRRFLVTLSDAIKIDMDYNEKNLQPIFLYTHKYFTNRNDIIDLRRNIYTLENVVHAALLVAIYMQFDKIVLLGCEMTSFYENLVFNATGEKICLHAHDNSITKLEKYDNSYMLSSYGRTLEGFKHLAKIAQSKGITIINCTPDGILDMFERKTLKEVLDS